MKCCSLNFYAMFNLPVIDLVVDDLFQCIRCTLTKGQSLKCCSLNSYTVVNLPVIDLVVDNLFQCILCNSNGNESRLYGLIVRVRVVPKRTVVGDVDQHFDNLSGSHHQSHVTCVSSGNDSARHKLYQVLMCSALVLVIVETLNGITIEKFWFLYREENQRTLRETHELKRIPTANSSYMRWRVLESNTDYRVKVTKVYV